MSTRGIGELEALTPGERLLIHRRRLGLNQREAARRCNISMTRYSLWERGQAVPTVDVPTIDELLPHERAMLYRRRCGTTQGDVATELGLCRWWVNLMERGERPCDLLIDYWEN